jgi:hypothetical protein
VKKGVFETLTLGTGGVYLGRTSRSVRINYPDRSRNDGISRPWRKRQLASALVQRLCAETKPVFTLGRRSTTVVW